MNQYSTMMNLKCNDEKTAEKLASGEWIRGEDGKVRIAANVGTDKPMTIQDLCKKHGCTIKHLCERFQIPRNTMQKWATDPDKPNYRKLAPYFVWMMDECLTHDEFEQLQEWEDNANKGEGAE